MSGKGELKREGKGIAPREVGGRGGGAAGGGERGRRRRGGLWLGWPEFNRAGAWAATA